MPASLAQRLFGLGGGARRIAFRPEPARIGDAAAARRMLGGRWRLAGAELRIPAEAGPWRIQPPTPAAAERLHGFAWLADLAAAGTRDARRAAQDWTFGWIARHGAPEGADWAGPLAGRRVSNWLRHADLILAGDDPELARTLAASLEAHARRLRRARGEGPTGLARLETALGELHVELALHAGERRRRRAAEAFAGAAAAEIDADGGLVSRNPEALAEALHVLALGARDLDALALGVPRPLGAALDRAQSAVRALRMRDGALPRFHGGGPGEPGRLDRTLALVHPRHGAPRRDAAMGFRRLAAGRATVVIDAAPPPPGPEAHAATLAFEFAFGARRIVANCGPGARFGGDWAAACRATAAQSTLALAGLSSARIAADSRGPGPHPFVRAPKAVEAETAEDVEGHWFQGAHDGWLESHGLLHRRRLYLSLDGRDFRGEDALEPPDAAASDRLARALDRVDGRLGFALRFHLPPEVAETAREETGGTVLLDLPEGPWRFGADAGAARLVESVAFDPEAPDPLPTAQILVTGDVGATRARLAWGFQRL